MIDVTSQDVVAGGVLKADAARLILDQNNQQIDELMLALLPEAAKYAVMPVSGYLVGAVALGQTGNLYFGASQDIGNGSLSSTIHAEQAAVAMAHFHGETRIRKLAVNAEPCGHCRQFLYELNAASELVILLLDAEPTNLVNLLPNAFGPKNLGVTAGLLLPQNHLLTLTEPTDEPIINQALQAAKKAYAPYTKAYSGVALQTTDGQVMSGSYLENVAFNPSLPPLQAALVHLIQSGYEYADIDQVVLAQIKGNIIDQAAATQMLLTSVNQNAKLTTVEIAL